MNDWTSLDAQLARWSSKLTDDLGVPASDASCLATVVSAEIAALDSGAKAKLLSGSPVTLQDRFDELRAFEAWMSIAPQYAHPAVVRAQVVTQNYVCFVYLRDDWFHALRGAAIPGSAIQRTTTFLTEDPVRAFRNAFSHGSWRYRPDFGALQYWARRDGKGPIVEWVTDQTELDFWQALSRLVAYVSIQTLAESAA